LLLSSMDLSLVRGRLVRSWTKMLEGRVSPQDYTFASEVRLGSYSSAATAPPAAIVAQAAMAVDPRGAPLRGERVRYVVVSGEAGARLRDLAVSPLALLRRPDFYRLNQAYYIDKQIIPALARVFSLCGANLHLWRAEMRHPVNRRLRGLQPPVQGHAPMPDGPATCLGGRSRAGTSVYSASRAEDGSTSADSRCEFSTVPHAAPVPDKAGHVQSAVSLTSARSKFRAVQPITSFFASSNCDLCGGSGAAGELICSTCCAEPQRVEFVLLQRRAQAERACSQLDGLCSTCTRIPVSSESALGCESLDCALFFSRVKASEDLSRLRDTLREVGLLGD
jgi:DNA polymerase zeta